MTPAGRRKALFGAVATSLVFGVLSALSPDYWWYAVLRALTGDCHPNIRIAASMHSLRVQRVLWSIPWPSTSG
jgi:predicted MFS family arabinose efflux permease